jgi:t-SNARE complex subunit (syntaxin)
MKSMEGDEMKLLEKKPIGSIPEQYTETFYLDTETYENRIYDKDRFVIGVSNTINELQDRIKELEEQIKQLENEYLPDSYVKRVEELEEALEWILDPNYISSSTDKLFDMGSRLQKIESIAKRALDTDK